MSLGNMKLFLLFLVALIENSCQNQLSFCASSCVCYQLTLRCVDSNLNAIPFAPAEAKIL